MITQLSSPTLLLHSHAIFQFSSHSRAFNFAFISSCGLVLAAIVYANTFHLVSIRTIVSIYTLMSLVLVKMIAPFPIHTKADINACYDGGSVG